MASIPLPALDVKPVQQPDVLGNYGRLLALKNEMAMAPIRQQAAQEQLQAANLQNQQSQMDLQARQALNQAYANSVTKDSEGNPTIDAKKLADSLATGPAAYQTPAVLKGITDFQKSRLDLQTSAASLQQKQADMLGSAASAIKAANYDPTLAHSLLDTLPQTPQTQMIRQMIDNNPQQFQQLVNTAIQNSPEQQKMLNAQKVAEIRTNTPEMQALKTFESQTGGNPLDYQQHKIDQQTQAEVARQTNPEVEAAKIRVANAEGAARASEYAQIRQLPVMDTKNGNALQYLSAADLNAANKTDPGRYVPAVEGAKALNKTATIEDIRGNINSVRQDLQNPKMPEFTANQRAAISLALGGNDPTGALANAFRGGVLGSLTSDQQTYLVNLAQLKENAMAMRSVLGAGQGSEDLRNAITATIPGPRTPSKQYGLKQLDAFENVLNRLEKGVPKVPLANNSQPQQTPVQPSGPKIGDIKVFPNGNKGKWDGHGWVAQ